MNRPGPSRPVGGSQGTPPPTSVPRLGMHVSIAGGMVRMAERARDFGCEAVQIFSRSPQGGKARAIPLEEALAARDVLDAAGVRPLVIHMPYFANLSSGDDGLRAYAAETLTGEFERASVLGAPYVVTHPGRPAEGTGTSEGIERALTSIVEAYDRASPAAREVTLLLENTAGSGRELGATLEDLAALLHRLEDEKGPLFGVCLDTCHAHAAGYDLSSPEGVSAFIRQAADIVGQDRLKAIHANDSAQDAGSHKDRHAPIGSGTIGETGFSALLATPALAGCPFLLETPGSDEERAADLRRLRLLRAELGPESSPGVKTRQKTARGGETQ